MRFRCGMKSRNQGERAVGGPYGKKRRNTLRGQKNAQRPKQSAVMAPRAVMTANPMVAAPTKRSTFTIALLPLIESSVEPICRMIAYKNEPFGSPSASPLKGKKSPGHLNQEHGKAWEHVLHQVLHPTPHSRMRRHDRYFLMFIGLRGFGRSSFGRYFIIVLRLSPSRCISLHKTPSSIKSFKPATRKCEE